jgi:hypothetical protein
VRSQALPRACLSYLSPSPFVAHECRSLVHPGLHLSDDEGCSRPLGRCLLRHVFEKEAVSLPVSYFILKRFDPSPEEVCYRWLSLVTVMLGVCVVGLSGSLAKSSGTGIIDGTVGQDLVSRAADLHARVMADDSSKVWIGVLFVLFAQLL